MLIQSDDCFRYHLDDEIKKQMGELEQDDLVSFDANDNEVSMVVPSLKVTSNVSKFLIHVASVLKFFFSKFFLAVKIVR